MKISTTGRYSLSILTELAKISEKNDENSNGFVSLKIISDKLGISFKYLEKIASLLVKNGYISVSRGKQGGYKLTKKVEEYNIGEILKLTEKNMEQLQCVKDPETCKKNSACKRQRIFSGLDKVINDYLTQFTLRDII